ncbi:LLM class flavin-dependent oxidoreductase [Zavarzinia sp. CC-PAN008]|uniref:LLM class flavin-dependent oxidoreductase n=1 Tax=Zavarzinia sp. CC-PAN008 TaxID=3243332 RepID=UPI003F748421
MSVHRSKHLHLIAFMKTGPTSHNYGMWRHPDTAIADLLTPERYEHVARVLEAGKFDGLFFEDLSGIYDTYQGRMDVTLARAGQMNLLDPLMVLPYVARATRHLGLGITLSTSFYHPFHIARLLGSLDHLSNGRVAWNVVTSAADLEAQNFGMERIPDRKTRYDKAEEAVEACLALWDTWEEGALVMDKAANFFADPAKVHYANYKGTHVATRGPLPTPRCPQGHPVIMQAGSSPRGREFAARHAEIIFTIQHGKQDMIDFRKDMHERMAAIGRDPSECVILPAVDVILGESAAAAEARRQDLFDLIDPEMAVCTVSSHIGMDLSTMELDKPVTLEARDQTVGGLLDALIQGANANGWTLREACMHYGASQMTPQLVGTATDVADRMQDLLQSGACDGFVMPPTTFPGMYEDFVAQVVPELQRRGVYRTAYTGKTLRENLQD